MTERSHSSRKGLGVDEQVSLKEAAKRWEVTVSAVRKYLIKGLPRNEDGTLTWAVAVAWRQWYNVPERSGNFRFRSLAKGSKLSACSKVVSPRPAGLDASASAADLLRALYGTGMVKLASVAKALGMEPAMQMATIQIVSAWLWHVAGDEVAFACGADGPPMDYTGVRKLTKAESEQADRWVEVADALLETK